MQRSGTALSSCMRSPGEYWRKIRGIYLLKKSVICGHHVIKEVYAGSTHTEIPGWSHKQQRVWIAKLVLSRSGKYLFSSSLILIDFIAIVFAHSLATIV